MSDIAINPASYVAPVLSDAVRSEPRGQTPPPIASAHEPDRVELSDRALLLSRLRDLPPIRTEVVDRVRGEINAGTYETPEKLSRALDALAEDLNTPD